MKSIGDNERRAAARSMDDLMGGQHAYVSWYIAAVRMRRKARTQNALYVRYLHYVRSV